MNILKNKTFVLLYILSGFFITNALVAEFIGVKIFSLEKTFGITPFDFTIFGVNGLGFNLTAGVLLWPVVFVMTDIINEYFGQKVVKFLSWLVVGLIVYAFIMVYLAIGLPPNDWWQSQSGLTSDASTSIADMDLSYSRIMGQGLWIIVGSMVAFLVGQLVDVLVFHRIKEMTGEKSIWLRATGSTLVSQFIDSFVVLFIAFYIGADWDFGRVMAIAIVNYIYKFVMAVLLTPVIYLVHAAVEKYLGAKLATQMKDEAILQ
ncbi:MAG TPA: queuosine precursor transporter [Saprospiraceae bacterium]|nr:queuosine precursor transporter [Saprospiraceae bacterium]